MRRHVFAILATIVTISQLSGCVVYERPYHPHYHWWYR
jgi:hypothetical protein